MVSDSEYVTCLRVLHALCRDPQAAQDGGAAAQVVLQASALLRVHKSLRRQAQRQRDRELINNTGIRLRRAAAAAPPLPPPVVQPGVSVQPPLVPSAPREQRAVGGGSMSFAQPGQGVLPAAPLAAVAGSPALPSAAIVPAGVAAPPPTGPAWAGARLWQGRRCYICKTHFERLHFFYDSLCAGCAAENYLRRGQSGDLRDRVALVTGARLKIGFAVALKLLRAGATVLATTRFPADARCRYQREPDYADWAPRLRICGLDLRHLPSIEAFADQAGAVLPYLDILVNNAAQTIRRPPAFYRHLIAGEVAATADREALARWPFLVPPAQSPALPGDAAPDGLPLSALLAQWPLLAGDERDSAVHFPAGQVDGDGQPLDLRPDNSWTLGLADVSTTELLEVHAINCIAPFILSRSLQPLFSRSPHPHRFIVNVSSMEGAFAGRRKSPRHPHTNMAKAALNMLTHTCAGDLAGRGIFINSVDTGWVTNEFPWALAQRMDSIGFAPPLDEIDGAARVCDPIFTGLATGSPVFGQFLKDYRAAAW